MCVCVCVCDRSREEVSGVRKERDPIDRLKRYALELGYATDASIKEVCVQERGVERVTERDVE